MKITLLLFGITTDLVGTSSLEIHTTENCSVFDFRNELARTYPTLKNLASYAIAVNENYADNEIILKENDVVAIIPPVSGG